MLGNLPARYYHLFFSQHKQDTLEVPVLYDQFLSVVCTVGGYLALHKLLLNQAFFDYLNTLIISLTIINYVFNTNSSANTPCLLKMRATAMLNKSTIPNTTKPPKTPPTIAMTLDRLSKGTIKYGLYVCDTV